MLNSKSITAIIPARGGSKGIPDKNIKIIGGKPLIAWTIETARRSKYIDRVITTTDSDKIAGICKEYNCEVPFMRPKHLANDSAKGTDVILHTLDWLKLKKIDYDYFILLQPTSPLRTTKHIDEAIEILISSENANSLVSVKKVNQHPFWMKRINNNGFVEEYQKDNEINYHNRQELPDLYVNNGAIYISKCDYFLKNKSFYKNECLPYIMGEKESIDIDTLDDLYYAEYLFSKN